MLHKKDLSRVKEVLYCAEEDKPITRADIVKGTETGKGDYVVVTDEELKKVAPPTASTIDILQFVDANTVDPIFFESSYYVAPEESVSKPYVLLMQAMSETKHHAVAKVAMHGREHIVIIRPGDAGLVLHTMYFVDELQKANAPSIKAGKSTAKEVELAKSLIEKLAGPFKPEKYRDEYRANVEKLLETKQRGEKMKAIPQPRNKKVVDIVEALQQSLKASAPGPQKKRVRRAA